ncbi:undecaprenyl-phosphate glucose phosphotransferase [Aliagarivorans taiwanensis]|uniref:undecaprenyl-phosphate glucose phosphotransferase n=1 Tax=Aliagarivorans taiwanensis TaxID=561966 RepID=UPI0003FBF8DD|nr:undecaprenyl-phosphate glucose phosphotransferase [Aliagarivorans taiwanensis]
MSDFSKGLVRSHEFELAVIYRIADLSAIFAVLACLVWWRTGEFEQSFQFLAIGFGMAYLLVAESFSLYRSWRVASVKEQASTTLSVWLVTVALVLAINYFLKISDVYSRLVVGWWLLLTPLVLVAWRLVFRELLALARRSGYNTRRAVIIGVSENALRLHRELISNPDLGLTFAGFFDDRASTRLNKELGEFGEVQPVSKALDMAKNGELNHVYIALPMHAKDRITSYLKLLSDTTCTTFIVPDFFTYNLIHSRWASLGEIQTISVFDTPFRNSASVWVKRIQDVLLASAIILLISPILLAVALGVKLSSPGPVLFKQDRYGLDGKRIRVWKFRSMRVMENGGKVVQATRDDPRITPFGSFIRRTSLDELPQFFNVLMGTMSIVGPRPHAVAHNEQFRQLVDRYMLRHKVKPGITGWAQINGCRGETDTLDKMERRVAYDLEYIQNWSLWMDLKIVYLTVFKGFTGDQAY